MTQVNFYHLTQAPLDKALPRLLEKVVAADLRVLLVAPDEEQVEVLNQALWTYTTKVFLPHGSKKDGFADQQPIYLTCDNENPNSASVCAMVYDAQPENVGAFEKAIYMFDGKNRECLQAARKRWKDYNAKGIKTVYWQQDEKGAWIEKQG